MLTWLQILHLLRLLVVGLKVTRAPDLDPLDREAGAEIHVVQINTQYILPLTDVFIFGSILTSNDIYTSLHWFGGHIFFHHSRKSQWLFHAGWLQTEAAVYKCASVNPSCMHTHRLAEVRCTVMIAECERKCSQGTMWAKNRADLAKKKTKNAWTLWESEKIASKTKLRSLKKCFIVSFLFLLPF